MPFRGAPPPAAKYAVPEEKADKEEKAAAPPAKPKKPPSGKPPAPIKLGPPRGAPRMRRGANPQDLESGPLLRKRGKGKAGYGKSSGAKRRKGAKELDPWGGEAIQQTAAERRFQPGELVDKGAFALFLLHLAGMCALSYYTWDYGDSITIDAQYEGMLCTGKVQFFAALIIPIVVMVVIIAAITATA